MLRTQITWSLYVLLVQPTAPFLIRHNGGLCVSVGSDNLLRLTSSCNEEFSFTSSKALQHKKTMKCVVPDGYYNGSPFKLTSNCQTHEARFEETSGFSLKHLGSKKCIHPSGGSGNPPENTKLILYSGCDQKRLTLKPEYGQ